MEEILIYGPLINLININPIYDLFYIEGISNSPILGLFTQSLQGLTTLRAYD